MQILFRYNFEIVYQTERQNVKADILSQRLQDFSSKDDDERQKHQLQTMIFRKNLHLRIQRELNLTVIVKFFTV